MFNFLFIPAFISYNFLTFGIQQYLKITPPIAASISIMSNSLLVSGSSYLYIQDKITMPTMINSFQFTLAFMVNDLLFRRHYDLQHGYWLKVLHHIIASLAIYRFPRMGSVCFLVPILFMSEISNIPLEIRNIMRHLKWKKYGIQGIMIGLLYGSFGYLRIYKIPIICCRNYQMGKVTDLDFFYFGCIYSLWCYWFLFMNFRIYELAKQKLGVIVSNKISDYFIKNRLLEYFRKSN